MKRFIFLLPIFLISYIFFAGQSRDIAIEKWNIDPSFTGLMPTNESIPVVSTKPVDFVFTTQPRIVHTRSGDVVVGPNFRPHPTTNTTQSEVIIVRHPINQGILFAGSNAVKIGSPLFISEGVYVSTNTGLSWYGTDTLSGAPIQYQRGDPGPTIDKDGRFIMTHLGTASSTSGMSANYSTDNGLTWSNTYTIASGSQDKNLAGSDDEPTSPYYGRSYCVWTPFTSTIKPIAVSYTSNGGVSWSTPQNINNPPSPYTTSQGCDVRVGPGGTVYVTWRDHGSSPYTGVRVGLGKSTNGGVNWTVTDQAFAMNGVRTTSFGSWGIRVPDFPRIDIDKTGGPRHGWIYIVTNEYNLAPAGSDADVILNASSDGGATWSASLRKRVNQDPMNNGKLQFFPAIRVDESGGINIVYYDNRNILTSDSAEIYVNRSVDGGTTWEEILVSDHRFRPKPISGLAGGYQGDYIGITSGNNKVWPVWMDDATGNYQLWTAALELGPSVSHTPLPNTENLNGPYTVNCVITPAGSPIVASETKLYWTRTTTFSNSVTMTNTGGNNWTANIPGNGSPATYRYYITTKDQLNRTATSPPGAPAAYHSFLASPDNTPPNITHTPIVTIPIFSWPATLDAVVTDNLGVDSVWAKWYINTPSVVKQFRLNNTSGNNYSGTFNSTNPEVSLTDSVFYRIYAKDNSSNHNIDSTSLYKITFIFFCEEFPTTTFNTAYWQTFNNSIEIINASGVATGTFPYPIPSPPYFVSIKGTTALLESKVLNLSSYSTAEIRLYESEHDLELGESVYLEYYSNTNTWQTLHHFAGTNNGFGTFEPFDTATYTLPANALHSGFKFRFRGVGLESTDEWFFDNICMYGDIMSNITGNSNIPLKYSLEQNYPNPFNPVTRINFSIPKQGLVTLKVYDVTGREVMKLVDDVMIPGYYFREFNGQSFASGVYFYKLESSDFVQTKKMILIK